MAITYRVIDVRETLIDPLDILIEGVRSPEEAARQALGIDVVRSGAKQNLVARVYWQSVGQPVNMVRLYKKPEAQF
ncbi:hypothetical protein [Devosia naphthalenivorans]|uniref:hypothetical protein n=1 Tax=Devosia naphthalenivorans TaxID=2082392 RepID=UPI000D36BC32|nr:hypothetical protein [Devosia naphthalenivorans]